MANVLAINGINPVCYKDGKPYTGQTRTYYKAAGTSTAIFVGDPVVRVTSTDPSGYPQADRYASGALTGHVVGIKLNSNDLSKVQYLAAADAGYLMVCDDPNVLLEGQVSGVGSELTLSAIGQHVGVSINNGSTVTQTSGCYIDNNQLATGKPYRVEAMGEAVKPGNTIGQYQRVLVAVNLSTEVNAGASNLSEHA